MVGSVRVCVVSSVLDPVCGSAWVSCVCLWAVVCVCVCVCVRLLCCMHTGLLSAFFLSAAIARASRILETFADGKNAALRSISGAAQLVWTTSKTTTARVKRRTRGKEGFGNTSLRSVHTLTRTRTRVARCIRNCCAAQLLTDRRNTVLCSSGASCKAGVRRWAK